MLIRFVPEGYYTLVLTLIHLDPDAPRDWMVTTLNVER